MKTKLLIGSLIFSSMALADIDTCLRDSKQNANHSNPVAPLEYCAEAIEAHPEKVSARSSDGYYVYGYKSLIYVQKGLNREVLSGDQTSLNDVKKISIDEKSKRILVTQEDSISIFNLGFIGNVSPLSFYKSPHIQNLISFKLMEGHNKIVLFYKNAVGILGSQVDTRHDDANLKPKFSNIIRGPKSELKNPSDAVYFRGKLAILDSDRVLVFENGVAIHSPKKVINLVDAERLLIKDALLFYVNSKGQTVEVEGID